MKATLRTTTLCITGLMLALIPASPAIGSELCLDRGASSSGVELALLSPVASVQNQFTAASTCTATATCGTHPDISCDGEEVCLARDRSCQFGGPNENGFVECDGERTDCPQDSACASDCVHQYDACIAQCTNRVPCVSDCEDQFNFCTCNC